MRFSALLPAAAVGALLVSRAAAQTHITDIGVTTVNVTDLSGGFLTFASADQAGHFANETLESVSVQLAGTVNAQVIAPPNFFFNGYAPVPLPYQFNVYGGLSLQGTTGPLVQGPNGGFYYDGSANGVGSPSMGSMPGFASGVAAQPVEVSIPVADGFGFANTPVNNAVDLTVSSDSVLVSGNAQDFLWSTTGQLAQLGMSELLKPVVEFDPVPQGNFVGYNGDTADAWPPRVETASFTGSLIVTYTYDALVPDQEPPAAPDSASWATLLLAAGALALYAPKSRRAYVRLPFRSRR